MITTISAGSSAKPEMKMKPKPSTTLIALGSIEPVPRSLNSGYSTAPTTIMPAARQATRKAKKMTMRRPIRAMASASLFPSLRAKRSNPALLPRSKAGLLRRFAPRNDGGDGAQLHQASIRHRHGAQRLAFAHAELFSLGLELAAGGEDVAAAWRAHRGRIAGIEDVFGEFFDSIPVRALVNRAGPRVERD